jgi:hypothetical protein
MLAAYNGIRLLNRVRNLGGNCLPVPATEWMYMSADRRAAWIADITSPDELAKLKPVPLPILAHIYRGAMLDGLLSSGPDDDPNDSSELAKEKLARATITYYDGAAALMQGATDVWRPFELMLHDEPFELNAIAAPRTVEKRGIQIPEDASDESEGSHKFYIRIRWGEQRYEIAAADQHEYQQVDAATWTQHFKVQLAVSIAKIVFAREAAQVPK